MDGEREVRERTTIGTNAEGARRYLGCSAGIFEELRARKIVKPLRRDWYAYDDLDLAICLLRTERDRALEQTRYESTTQSVRREKPARTLRRQGDRPCYPSTEELLRKLG